MARDPSIAPDNFEPGSPSTSKNGNVPAVMSEQNITKRSVLSGGFVHNLTKDFQCDIKSKRMQDILHSLLTGVHKGTLKIDFKSNVVDGEHCYEAIAITSEAMSVMATKYGHSCALHCFRRVKTTQKVMPYCHEYLTIPIAVMYWTLTNKCLIC
jgi:hypothetical protein